MRKKRERSKAEIETGSFSDISFLLIIFFVLTTTLSKPTGRLVEVPSAAPPEQQAQAEDKTPAVHVFADRFVFGRGTDADGGEELTLPELKSRLLEMGLGAKPEKERCVVVEIADEVDWDRYFKVVTTIAQAGGVVALVEGEK